jgi:hypothetical protein
MEKKFICLKYKTTMSHLVTKSFGSLSAGQIALGKSSVTQLTSITTGVTLNASAGVITTVSSTLAADTSATFTITNSNVQASSLVLANVVNYSGTQGAPVLRVQNVTGGAFSVVLRNVDDTDALNGIMKIAFIVL